MRVWSLAFLTLSAGSIVSAQESAPPPTPASPPSTAEMLTKMTHALIGDVTIFANDGDPEMQFLLKKYTRTADIDKEITRNLEGGFSLFQNLCGDILVVEDHNSNARWLVAKYKFPHSRANALASSLRQQVVKIARFAQDGDDEMRRALQVNHLDGDVDWKALVADEGLVESKLRSVLLGLSALKDHNKNAQALVGPSTAAQN